MPAWRVAGVAAAGVAVMGAAVALGVAHPRLGGIGAEPSLAVLTPLTVVAAGLLDGINPCAVTVLLLLIAALLAATQVGGAGAAIATRGRVLVLGSVYVGAVFLTYLGAGAGLLSAGFWFTRGHLPSRLAALASVVLGLWMLKDAVLPSAGPRLEAPHGLTARAQGLARRARVPALILGGFLIGLCTIPCSGAVYLAIVALLAAQRNPLAVYGYLVLYNLMFIVPLLAILAIASSRRALAQLSRWQREHRERVRLAIGTGVTALGLALLAAI